MKKHYYKRSELTLFVYESLLNGGITMKEVHERTGLTLSTTYLIIEDIQLYLSDFFRYDLELIKEKDKYYLRKVK